MTWVNSFRGRSEGSGTTIKRIPHDWEHSNQKSGLEAKRRAKPEDGDGDETEEGQTSDRIVSGTIRKTGV
uniref:Uncharacterized protein n=1 Tax=Vespula pensylvanica TaxID=30213 RepID=A0A834P3J1_VESPE|nr:hypothetical protein H0235_006849 [Vespula pensylvanica]